MKLQTLHSLVIAILLVLLGGVIGFQVGTGKNVPGVSQVLQAIPQFSRIINVKVPQDKSNVDFSQFWVVWQRLEGSYLDPQKLDAKKMVYGAIQGMVASLGDPYTLYLPPEDQKRTTESLQG